MIRWLITLLLVLVLTVGTVLFVLEDPGYALFSIGGYTIETTISLLLVALVATYIIAWVFIRIIAGIWTLPESMHEWRAHRKRKRARWDLYQGLVDLAQGHWKSAEKRLTRHIRDSEIPLLNYLGAARAAQQQGSHEMRDRYLQHAYEHSPGSELALGLTRAELQVSQGQLEQALAGLRRLQEKEARNNQINKLLMQLYRQLGEWDRLQELLPVLRKDHIIDDEEGMDLEYEISRNQMMAAVKKQDNNAIRQIWNRLSRSLRDQDRMILEYAHNLQSLQQGVEAEGLLGSALRYRWNPNMVYLYGMVKGSDTAQQIRTAETWLKDHGRDSVLHLSLGRLCMRERLWGKARIYLETSLKLEPRSETYRELGALLEHLGDEKAATECYRNGLGLAVNHLSEKLPDIEEHAEEAEKEK